jgi:hypothetical protein
MNDGADGFFRALGERGHEPLLAKVTGSARFDIVENGHVRRWLLDINKGDVTVSSAEGSPDCTIRGNRLLFDELVSGQSNAMAAVLRGALVCTGDVELLLAIQRIFPSPPAAARPDQRVRSGR